MKEQNPDDFTDSEDLLSSITYGIRKFYFAGSWTDILIGVMLEETDDSFLVALPARITTQEGLALMDPVLDVAYARFLKTDFRAVVFAEGLHRKMYLEYLISNSPKVFPELLDMIGEGDLAPKAEPKTRSKEQMYEDMQDLSLMDEETRQKLAQVDEILGNAGISIETPPEELAEGILVKGTVTDRELKTTVEDAMKEGRFLPPQGKLPN